MPRFFKYLDLDKHFLKLVIFRLIQAIWFTGNMAHPDEYWQVTQVAYKTVYGDVDLPWEYHNDYRLRNTIYPLIHVLPLWILKTLGLDTNTAVRLCPYLFHSIFVLISDYYLWLVGKQTVGKDATQVALIFYLTNRT